jgi:hypothetical protein
MTVMSLLGIGPADTKEESCADTHGVSRTQGKRDIRIEYMRKCDAERKTS